MNSNEITSKKDVFRDPNTHLFYKIKKFEGITYRYYVYPINGEEYAYVIKEKEYNADKVTAAFLRLLITQSVYKLPFGLKSILKVENV